jgi:hypothetical protein
MSYLNNDRYFETTEDKIRDEIETARIKSLEVTEVWGLSGFEEQQAIKMINDELKGGDTE